MLSKVRGPDVSMETKATSHLWFHQAKVPPEQLNHAACGNPGFGYAGRKRRQAPDPSEDPQRTLSLCRDVRIVREDTQVFRQQSEEDERMPLRGISGRGCPAPRGVWRQRSLVVVAPP